MHQSALRNKYSGNTYFDLRFIKSTYPMDPLNLSVTRWMGVFRELRRVDTGVRMGY